jgi:type IV secretion system protein VirD4
MTPDEVLRLKPPQKRGDGAQERIVAPGQMLIFVSGHHPILGTQMLYFLDPALNSRAELAPPTEFFTLEEDGKAVPQHALNRTRHAISKPEFVSPPDSLPGDEPLSGVEHHLVEELHLEQGEE